MCIIYVKVNYLDFVKTEKVILKTNPDYSRPYPNLKYLGHKKTSQKKIEFITYQFF